MKFGLGWLTARFQEGLCDTRWPTQGSNTTRRLASPGLAWWPKQGGVAHCWLSNQCGSCLLFSNRTLTEFMFLPVANIASILSVCPLPFFHSRTPDLHLASQLSRIKSTFCTSPQQMLPRDRVLYSGIQAEVYYVILGHILKGKIQSVSALLSPWCLKVATMTMAIAILNHFGKHACWGWWSVETDHTVLSVLPIFRPDLPSI